MKVDNEKIISSGKYQENLLTSRKNHDIMSAVKGGKAL
jgi:hypothetical protein